MSHRRGAQSLTVPSVVRTPTPSGLYCLSLGLVMTIDTTA
jgi:hypothetical protein